MNDKEKTAEIINVDYNPNAINNYGWICPRCGRGNSPIINTCPCTPLPRMAVTCGNGV